MHRTTHRVYTNILNTPIYSVDREYNYNYNLYGLYIIIINNFIIIIIYTKD